MPRVPEDIAFPCAEYTANLLLEVAYSDAPKDDDRRAEDARLINDCLDGLVSHADIDAIVHDGGFHDPDDGAVVWSIQTDFKV